MTEQDINLDLELKDKKFTCSEHPESQIKVIYFGEQCPFKSRFLCIKTCKDADQYLKSLIDLRDFFQQPQKTFQSLFYLDKINLQTLTPIVQQLEQIYKSIEQKVRDQQQKLSNALNQLKELINKTILDIISQVKFDQLTNQFKTVWKMNSHQGTKEFEELEKQLNQMRNSLTEISNESNNRVTSFLKLLQDGKQDFETFQKQIIDVTAKLGSQFSSYLNNYSQVILDFPSVHTLISDNKQVRYELLYQGTRDGLNSQSYWLKCNQQSHLLTIMTSQNGNKFGGYSPCVNNNQISNYVTDPTNKSFLFQYNKREIYKIKPSQNAIYCQSNYGPAFGSGHDLLIQANFKGGSSNLGTSYDTLNFIVNEQTRRQHLFGGNEPQLIECIVYKVHFI